MRLGTSAKSAITAARAVIIAQYTARKVVADLDGSHLKQRRNYYPVLSAGERRRVCLYRVLEMAILCVVKYASRR